MTGGYFEDQNPVHCGSLTTMVNQHACLFTIPMLLCHLLILWWKSTLSSVYVFVVIFIFAFVVVYDMTTNTKTNMTTNTKSNKSG